MKLYHERSSGRKMEFRNSSFRGETSQRELMKEIKNAWAEAKQRVKRECNKVRTIGQIWRDTVLKCPGELGRIDTLFKNTFTET